MGGGLDLVALVKTTDRSELIRRVGTADPHGVVDSDQLAEWLAALDQDEPFVLNEIGTDYVAGRFAKTPKDPAAVAARCAALAPELTKGSGSAIDLLTEEIKVNRTLYLILVGAWRFARGWLTLFPIRLAPTARLPAAPR